MQRSAATSRSGRYHRLFRLTSVVAGALGIGLAVWSLFAPSLALPFSVIRLESHAAAVLGLLIAAAAIVLYFVPSRLSVSLFFVTLAGIMTMIVAAHPPERGERDWSPFEWSGLQRIWTSSLEWYEPYTKKDPLFGSIGKPGVVARAHHRDFNVHYTIAEDGFRRMPSGPKGAPDIVITGCSFTFGIGVEDDESYPALLARKAWPNYNVLNWSYSGWGTAHACLAVEKALERNPKPALILYGFFFGHVVRNDLRKSWHRSTRTNFPLFDDQGKYLGLKSPWEATHPDSPEQDKRERAITRALLTRMKNACDQAGVPFAVIFLVDGAQVSEKAVLEIPGLNVLDVTGAYNEAFPNDGHPTPLCQRRLARAIASSPLLAQWTGRADLHRPDAFPTVFPEETGFRLMRWRDDDVYHQRGAEFSSTETSFHVDRISNFGDVVSTMQVTRPIPPLQRRDQVRIEFDARADQARSIMMEPRMVARNWIFWSNVQRIELKPEAKKYRLNLPVQMDASEPMISFAFGGDTTAFSVSNFEATVINPEAFGGYWLECHPPDEANFADIHPVPEMEGAYRIDSISCAKPMPWKVQVLSPGLPVARDAFYRVRGWIRSDRPKHVYATIVSDPPAGPPIGEFRRIDATPEWTHFDVILKALKDAEGSQLSLQLGEDEVPIEFKQVVMEIPSGN